MCSSSIFTSRFLLVCGNQLELVLWWCGLDLYVIFFSDFFLSFWTFFFLLWVSSVTRFAFLMASTSLILIMYINNFRVIVNYYVLCERWKQMKLNLNLTHYGLICCTTNTWKYRSDSSSKIQFSRIRHGTYLNPDLNPYTIVFLSILLLYPLYPDSNWPYH